MGIHVTGWCDGTVEADNSVIGEHRESYLSVDRETVMLRETARGRLQSIKASPCTLCVLSFAPNSTITRPDFHGLMSAGTSRREGDLGARAFLVRIFSSLGCASVYFALRKCSTMSTEVPSIQSS